VDAPERRARRVETGVATRKQAQTGSKSWWTARATSEVAPGFTRQALTAEAQADPGAPGGLFERLGGLLDRLNQGL